MTLAAHQPFHKATAQGFAFARASSPSSLPAFLIFHFIFLQLEISAVAQDNIY